MVLCILVFLKFEVQLSAFSLKVCLQVQFEFWGEIGGILVFVSCQTKFFIQDFFPLYISIWLLSISQHCLSAISLPFSFLASFTAGQNFFF